MKLLFCRLLALACASSLVFGCGKSEKSMLCFLATYATQSHSTTYGYSEGTRLTTETTTVGSETYVTTYLYNNLGLITQSTKSGAGLTHTTNYVYDGAKRLLTREEDRTDEIERITYSYNSNGQVATVTTRLTTATDILIKIEICEYADIATKNPAAISSNSSLGIFSTYLEYDNKINPLRGFLPSIQPYNNVTKRTINGIVETIVYQYNGEGYPTSATSSTGKTETWTYSCQEI